MQPSISPIVHCSWPLAVKAAFDRHVHIYVDQKKATPKNRSEYDVLYLSEPRVILPWMSAYALSNLHLFDLVVPPKHDRLSGDNVLSICGSPHRVTPERLASELLAGADCVPERGPVPLKTITRIQHGN
jgi:hypothetical protein